MQSVECIAHSNQHAFNSTNAHLMQNNKHGHVQQSIYIGTEITHHLDWVSINEYTPEFVDTSLDIPEQMVDQQFFDCIH